MKDQPSQDGEQRRSVVRALLLLALLGASVVFMMRGPLHALGNSLDFILVYGASRTWLVGGNPYDKPTIDRVWEEAGGPTEKRPSLRTESALIYPPTTLVMFAPFAVLPWMLALPTWIMANIAFLLISVYCIGRLAGFVSFDNGMIVYLTLALVFAPVHTAIRFGQTPLYVLALLAVGAWACRSASRGVALGFASLIKPQLGLPFVALDFVQRRFVSMLWALGCVVIIAGISISPFKLRGISWFPTWRANVLNQQDVGGQGDPTPANPMRFQMVNLQYPLHELVQSRALVNGLVWTVCGVLAIVFFRPWLWKKVKAPGRHQTEGTIALDGSTPWCRDALLALSFVAVLTLMIVYHRFYDAVLLLFPLGWALQFIAQRKAITTAVIALILLLPFFLNSATALYWLEYNKSLPAWLVECRCWHAAIMPHQGWSLVALAVALTCARLRGEERADCGP